MARFSSTAKYGRHAARGSPAATVLIGGLVSIAAFVSLAGGCSARSIPPPVTPDCSEEALYDLHVVENYDMANSYGWYSYGDNTPGALNTTGSPGGAYTVEDGGINYSFTAAIEGGGLCGTQRGLFLQAFGFQDYGSGWGTYSIGGYAGPQACPSGDGGTAICPIDVSAYEGVSFWARSFDPTGAPTTKGFTLSISDKNSHAGGLVLDASTSAGLSASGVCVNYEAGTLGNGAMVYVPVGGGAMGPIGGGTTSAQALPDACGNNFSYAVLTTERWQFYTIPWSSFNQSATPNRIPAGFDPATFFQFVVVAPREARLALWIDKLGFYRKKGNIGFDAATEAGP